MCIYFREQFSLSQGCNSFVYRGLTVLLLISVHVCFQRTGHFYLGTMFVESIVNQQQKRKYQQKLYLYWKT